MTENEAVSLPKNLVASIMHVLAGLPAGQVARMLIALDDAMNPKGETTEEGNQPKDN